MTIFDEEDVEYMVHKDLLLQCLNVTSTAEGHKLLPVAAKVTFTVSGDDKQVTSIALTPADDEDVDDTSL